MATWKYKICRGMDVVESISFVRKDLDANGNEITCSAVHIPNELKPRADWLQAEIDAIGETVVADLDAELERLKTNPIGAQA